MRTVHTKQGLVLSHNPLYYECSCFHLCHLYQHYKIFPLKIKSYPLYILKMITCDQYCTSLEMTFYTNIYKHMKYIKEIFLEIYKKSYFWKRFFTERYNEFLYQNSISNFPTVFPNIILLSNMSNKSLNGHIYFWAPEISIV